MYNILRIIHIVHLPRCEKEQCAYVHFVFSLQKPRLKEILWEIKGRQETDDDQWWVDSCRFLQRKKFNPLLPISVRFADDQGTSEGAVDAGGPRREFLRLLLKACHLHSGIFCGSEHHRVLFLNFDGRSNK